MMKSDEILTAYNSLSDSQKERFERSLKDMISVNLKIYDTTPEVCPVCGSTDKFVKAGIHGKKQRYMCCGCKHRFTYDSGTITSGMIISTDEFIEIGLDTLALVPIAVTAARLNRSIQTIFNNRHKFLSMLEEYLKRDNVQLSGTIETDGKYIQESCKGSKPVNREARHRGEASHFRGLSHEKTCVVTFTDRNGHEAFRAISMGPPTEECITSNFKNQITSKSVIYTDGTNKFEDLAKATNCMNVRLKDYSDYNQVEHINTVNSIHSMIQDSIRKYRGVATKYMNRYASLFVFMRKYQQMDDNEKRELLLSTFSRFRIIIRTVTLKTQNIFTGDNENLPLFDQMYQSC